MLFVVAIVCAVSAYADDTTCRVYGTNNVATIVNTVVTGSTAVTAGSGNHFVDAKVELTERAEKDINVAVKVSDGSRVIATGVVRITQGYTSGDTRIDSPSIREGVTYYLYIAGASCQ